MRLLACLSLGLFGCLLGGPFMGGVRAKDCASPNWLSHQDQCYSFFSEQLTWSQAQHYCETNGGHLANIGTDQEYEAIASFLIKLGAYEDVWTEEPLNKKNSNFDPTAESYVAYTPWGPHAGTFDMKEKHCAVLDKTTAFKHGKFMPCENTFPFLCEMDRK